MKNKKRYLIAALGLSTCLTLSSCGESEQSKKISIGDYGVSKISYENDVLNGKISYSNLEKGFIKIVTLSYNEKILEPKLMGINIIYSRPLRGGGYDSTNYIDLDTGVVQLSYCYYLYSEDEKPQITIGENFKIEEEIPLFDFIVEENWLQDEYDINDLIEFYNEKVKPKLNKEENYSSLKRKVSF